ncbi:s-adenosylmethionine tRNA ribosyltransferase protein [Teratosphaeria destructans]|uniref:S-adenosylmethionine tRNA ribosyltransferase protein n=1 Tax=Teratosphaeria destructans TaxID=418781 RepID=A0A9W7T2I9_9PEZI|nr:s-adenosylmethionine tRNA ribosyltransferase protein [Teratosphaeria destructans]
MALSGGSNTEHDRVDMLREKFNHFLAKREPPKTFCPSEVARAWTRDELGAMGYAEWRDAMDDIRHLAAQLRDQGLCEVVQQGHVVDALSMDDIKGPIRLRRKTPS